jgi:RNA polymerase sigma factor (sigma-70 family)
MAEGRLSGVLRHLSGTALGDGTLSDGQLLERFVGEHDEAAFALLVRRHGPMVLGVCRRVLGDAHAAEDAFQATFLALVRKAATLSARELVAHWLFGVAQRTARYARRTAYRRRAVEKQVAHLPERAVTQPEARTDVRTWLDQEVSRLPAVYRIPVVLCELEGKSRQEAAQQLGVPEGTLSSRLARARQLLRKRLVRQGLLPGGAALLPSLGEGAAVPAALLRTTVQAAVHISAGQGAGAVAAPVADLLRTILRQMALARVKTATLVLLTVALASLAIGLAVRQAWPRDPADEPSPGAAAAPAAPVEDARPPDLVRIAAFDRERWVNLEGFVNVNGTLFFTAGVSDSNGQLWKCTATATGVKTTCLTSIPPNVRDGRSTPTLLTNAGGTLYFVSRDAARGLELWKSDGTPAGTVPVRDLNPGGVINPPPEPGRLFHAGLMAAGKTLYFVADDGNHGCLLQKSDGTAAGTGVVKPVTAWAAAELSARRAWADVGGTLFFAGGDRAGGQELWQSDGTAQGTRLVKDIRAGADSSEPCFFTNVGGTLFFTADDGVHGRELWKSDGTEAGTRLVKDINPGRAGAFPNEDMGNLINVNGTLFFMADDGVHGLELWKSDGTEQGTVMVKDINPGPASSVEWRRPGDTAPPGLGRPANPGNNVRRHGLGTETLAVVNGTLFFVADDGVHGYELWKSDGTAAGTVLVKDIADGARDADPVWLTNVGGTLFFQAGDGLHHRKLWKSDGTAAGTVPVKDFVPAGVAPLANGAALGSMTAVGGGLFFIAARWGPNEPFPGRRLDLWYLPPARRRPH